MPDYSKTIIYKLINYDYPDLVYVGSTTNFTKRKQHHKEATLNDNSKKYKIKVYENIRQHGGWESWTMIKICDYPCNNRREAEKEEDKYMIELKSNLHMRRPFQTTETKQKYFDDRKDIKKEYDKERRNGEKAEEIKAKKREAYHRDKDKNKGEKNEKKREYDKQYRENNKEKMRERYKKNYEKNKEKISERNKEKRKEEKLKNDVN